MMKHMVQRSLPFLVLAGLVACKGDPTGDLRNGTDHLLADPSSLFLGVGADTTKFVKVSAVDEQGNLLGESFRLGAVTGPFTVTLDTTFTPIVDPDGTIHTPKNPTTVRYIVKTLANTGNGSFLVSAGGQDITIPIRMLPDTGVLTLSSASPALGDTIVATLEANLRYTSASEVSIAGGVSSYLVSISADSTQLKFLPGPGAVASKVTVSGIRLSYSPGLGPIDAVSAGALTTPTVPPITAVFSTTTPDINQNVTVTAPASIKFLPGSRIFFGTDEQVVASVAADSNSLVMRPHKAGASGAISFGNVALSVLTVVPITVNSTNTATVSATVVPLAGTGAIATAPLIVIPDSGQTSGVIDAGATTASADCGVGAHCRFYKFVLTEARTFSISITWGNTADIGGYFVDDQGNDLFEDFACDANGSGAAGQPETCEQHMDPGTYYLALADFTAAAQNTTFTVAITGK